MEEAFEFLKKCGTFYIATEEGNQPRVRPFGVAEFCQWGRRGTTEKVPLNFKK